MLVILFVFDWRLGLLSLVPTLVAFGIMAKMTGRGMAEKMKQYQCALEDMNNEAVEYVRGIPVVKTFGQTVFSFKRFKGSIDRYNTWVVAYTKELMRPMLWFTTGNQQRLCAAHRRGTSDYGSQRGGAGISHESDFLYHLYADHFGDAQ